MKNRSGKTSNAAKNGYRENGHVNLERLTRKHQNGHCKTPEEDSNKITKQVSTLTIKSTKNYANQVLNVNNILIIFENQ